MWTNIARLSAGRFQGGKPAMENVEKSVEGVCASTISGQGAMQLSPELHHPYLCLGNSLGRTGAIFLCRYAAPIKVIELS